jgi:hypothetical protein
MVSVDGTDLDSCDDLYDLYRHVGWTLNATISNMVTDDRDFAIEDIEQCERLIQYLRDRVEKELPETDDE